MKPEALPWLVALACGCEPSKTCEEDIRAQTLASSVELRLGDATVTAELARSDVERERGWKHRQCNLEAVVLDPPQREPTPVWGCDLTLALDVISVVDTRIVAIERLEACPSPCEGCLRIGTDQPVDAIVEVPADALEVMVGDDVQGLP